MNPRGTCAAPACTHDASTPRFTAALSSIEAPRRRGTRIGRSTTQPKYFCACCGHKEYPAVSSFDGSRIPVVVKSYEVRDGEMIPLPRSQQYEVIHPYRGR